MASRTPVSGRGNRRLWKNNNDKHFDASPSTTLRQSLPPSGRRPALQSRDRNASIRVSSASGTPSLRKGRLSTMAPEKQSTPGTGSTRPLMPTLSASAKAAATRAPLTPRVAGVQTTGTRRVPRSDVAGGKEDTSTTPTPIAAFLSNNVTPRSGSRSVRVDGSANSTPLSTPRRTPAPEATADFEKEILRKANVQFSPSIADGGQASGSPSDPQADSKFFFANDAKAGAANSRVVRPQHPPKAASFVYANGSAIPSPPVTSGASALGSSFGEETIQPKFFHADGAPENNSPYFPPPRTSSSVSTSSRLTSPKLAAAHLSPRQSPRPLSPTKSGQIASPALRSIPSLPSPMMSRPKATERGLSVNGMPLPRRVSIESTHRTLSHKRSASAESPDARGMPTKRISSGSQASPSPATPCGSVILTAGTVSTPEEIKEEDETIAPAPALQSPTRPCSNIQTSNDLAANARRERKVLDLEITNSSLTAINRTLERELRKQAAELRRYRRLSRTGRLSLATSASLRTISGTSSIFSNDTLPSSSFSDSISDSENESTEEESEELESEDESLVSDSELSFSARDERDAKHRAKDEKRLRVDLTKHQQLLVDSQRLNQSLKRCLGWTDNLIQEGRRALEYNVRVSDVKLGGRVLVRDEVDEDDGAIDIQVRDPVVSQEPPAQVDMSMPEANTTSSWTKVGRDDRDSGIEVDAPGPLRRGYQHR